jgi:hypothetical protein
METETVVPPTNERTDNEKKPIYNEIPKQVSRKDFNKYINPHLSKPKKGPRPKLSYYKIFNYILFFILVSNGINSRHDAMRYTGQMFTHVITDGLMSFRRPTEEQKMVHIRNYFPLLSFT